MSDYLDFLQKNVPVAEDTEAGKQAAKSKVTAKAENIQTGEADNTPISKDSLLDMSQANMGFSMLAPEQKKNYETGEQQEPQPLQGGMQANNPALEATNMGGGENLNIQTPTNPIAGGNNLANPMLSPNTPKQKVSDAEIYQATPLPAIISYSNNGQFEISKADKNNKHPTMGLYMIEIEGETLLQIAEKASKWLGKTISTKDLISYNYMALSGFSETTPLAKDGTLWLTPEPNEPNTAVKIERIVPMRPVKKSVLALAPENGVAQDAINDNVPTSLFPADKNDTSEIEAFTVYLKAIEVSPTTAEVPTFLEDVASLWTASIEIARLDKSLLYYVADVGAPAALWAIKAFAEDVKILFSGTDWEGTEKSRLWSLLWLAADVFGVGVMCKFTAKLARAASRTTGKLGKPAFELFAKVSDRAGDFVKLSDDKINAGLAYFAQKAANAGADFAKLIDETIEGWFGAADNLALEGAGGLGKIGIGKVDELAPRPTVLKMEDKPEKGYSEKLLKPIYKSSTLAEVKLWIPTEANAQGKQKINSLIEKLNGETWQDVFRDPIYTTTINGKTYLLDGHNRVQAIIQSNFNKAKIPHTEMPIEKIGDISIYRTAQDVIDAANEIH